ncbi:Fpg/Nei family DNA glycosylase [Nocardioides sp. TRM66260-LWL]|uniref:Fpg/Nei family DNA glycosylase n=1 Tax=Nocardioides sp. TRM66260-LWL TaxID=2874478 RepID=UPI001CC5EB04|nr:DNA-formamidopyrimidine glycosylase family protein [Nocardioides sp. TRM66260-LWL]MBZ5734001.1 Fpg/Nei family DNA glycosylase [Nocardioides sp. TRM66260-LWL]
MAGVPEGHTIHRIARHHDRLIVGHRVEASSPQGRFAEGAALIDGQVLAGTDAWGKHLFHRYDDLWVHVHLGLFGKFRDGALPAPEPRGALRMRLLTDTHWVELRGPTACEVLTDPERDAILARLGPDPLRRGADAEAFVSRVTRSRAPIGAMLMDQSVIAGVGNVYRAEVLFRHGLSPFRAGREHRPEAVQAVWDDLVVLLRAGVRAGRIVTTEPGDRERPTGRVRRVDAHYVYGRAGLPCRRCGTEVESAEMVARRLFWCPACQP